MAVLELVKELAPLIGGVVVALPPWLKVMQDGKSQRASLVQIATDAAASVIGDLRAEIDRHKAEIDRLEAETSDCRERGMAKELRIAELEAEVRRLRSDLARHERQCPTLASQNAKRAHSAHR